VTAEIIHQIRAFSPERAEAANEGAGKKNQSQICALIKLRLAEIK